MHGAQLVSMDQDHVCRAADAGHSLGGSFAAALIFLDLRKVRVAEDSDERLLVVPRKEKA